MPFIEERRWDPNMPEEVLDLWYRCEDCSDPLFNGSIEGLDPEDGRINPVQNRIRQHAIDQQHRSHFEIKLRGYISKTDVIRVT